MNKFLVFFVLILVAAIGAVGFWYWQSNQWSKETLKLEILGRETAQAGDEVEYLVQFKNNGKVRLEDVELIFDYPEHTIPVEGRQERTIEPIEDIYPGEERVVSFKGILLGKENENLEAKAIMHYRPKNLKAPYESKTSFVVQITSVPITFEFDLPLKNSSGEEIEFSLNYFSNINTMLENLRVKINYPAGFSFLSAQPVALDETEWSLSSLAQAEGGKIKIVGAIEGEEGTRKTFQAQLGIIQDGEFVILKETSHSVEIIAPSVFISQMINSSQNYVANTEELLHYEIFFKNIGKNPLQKKFLLAKLEGEFFDLSTLKSVQGEIGRGDNSIIWDWKTVPVLRFLDADQEEKVEFWVRTKAKEDVKQKIKNPVLQLVITLGGVEKVFETKINSEVLLSQQAFYQEEVFGNSGPLPPVVGQKTTYTVFWKITNYWNDLENVKVKTILPSYVAVTGKFFPENAKFTFDSQSREVLWNVGGVAAFTGVQGTPLTLAFQIELTPDASQRDQTPLLVDIAEVLGEDVFTSDIIQEKAEGVNTTLPDDETVSEEQGVVQ